MLFIVVSALDQQGVVSRDGDALKFGHLVRCNLFGRVEVWNSSKFSSFKIQQNLKQIGNLDGDRCWVSS